jgi:UDP-N-acetylmuramoyl-L-alanyl-D-glutamate--2,6-diaminopimelate ligase
LVEAANAGADSAVLEASSHALDQHRTDGIRFAAGVFTNLTGDHRDYHPTQEHYLHAKKRLFDGLEESAVAVINADDPAGQAMIADCSARVLRFGTDARATLRAESVQMRSNGSSFLLITPLGEAPLRCSLIGHHNVSNVLAAAGVATAMGIDPQTVARGIGGVRSVRGRLERINDNQSGITVLIDYAHTDDALDNVLRAVKPICAGRLILVFGCGGDRDRSKRPRMAKVAQTHADEFVLTSDNPRTEDPMRILHDVLAGFSSPNPPGLSIQNDRRKAIELAIDHARPGDTVLIAGKGHEDYQVIGNDRIWFDDAAVARESLHLTKPTKGNA